MKRGLNLNLDQLRFDINNCQIPLKKFCLKSIQDVIKDPKEIISMRFGFNSAKDTLFISTGKNSDYFDDYYDDMVRSIVFVNYCQNHYRNVLYNLDLSQILDSSKSELSNDDIYEITDQYIARQLRNASLVFGDILQLLWSNDVQRQCINRLEEAYFNDMKQYDMQDFSIQLRKSTFDASKRLDKFFDNYNVLPTYGTIYYVYELNAFIDKLPEHFKTIYYANANCDEKPAKYELPSFNLPKDNEDKQEESGLLDNPPLSPTKDSSDIEWEHIITSAVKGISLLFGTVSFISSLKKMLNQ